MAKTRKAKATVHTTPKATAKRGGKQYENSKKQQAVCVYAEMTNGRVKPRRKDVIARFASELGLTEQSASLYNHLLHSGKWDNLLRKEKRAMKKGATT